MTKDELYKLVGHQDLLRDLDIKTLVLDLVRERMTEEDWMAIFWCHLPELDEAFIRDYFYRRFSS